VWDLSCLCAHELGIRELMPNSLWARTAVKVLTDLIRKEAWFFCRTNSSVRLWWELKDPKGYLKNLKAI